MRTIVTILVIFLQCAYLHAKPKPGFMQDMGEYLGSSDSCMFGVKSVSVFLYKNISQSKNISTDEICNNVNPLQKIAFIVHGFISSGNTSAMQELASRLFQRNYTVFITDWSQGACTNGMPIWKFLEYSSAVNNTRKIGEHIASYVESLINKCKFPLKNIILIGHSLGAHICGFAAKVVKSKHGKVPLIVALDPASPMFSNNNCSDRLCKSDAFCVRVLQTSSLGMFKVSNELVGDLNLQFDNGMLQPGCGMNIVCSHSRPIEYLSETLKDNCGFPTISMSSYENKKSLFSFSLSSSYLSSNTDCIFMNSKILDTDKCTMKGQFYVFVDKVSYCKLPHESLNCKPVSQ